MTSRVSKHRFYIWCSPDTIADTRVVVFASDRDYFAGVLHSAVHHAWFMATSSRHGVGNDPTYNTKTCFDTFTFPWLPHQEPTEADSPLVRAIADAARNLFRLRDAWLNPIMVKPPRHKSPLENAFMKTQLSDDDLRMLTLSNLYNERPTWLSNAHRTLDEAVFAAYGWPANLTTQEILARLLALNHERAAAQISKTADTKPRKPNTSKPLTTSPIKVPT